MTFDDWWGAYPTQEDYEANCRDAWEAGAASRDAEVAEMTPEQQRKMMECAAKDAEIAELVAVLGNVTAHLAAAHSLLSRGGKKAAASDTIFKIMLQDYEKSFEAGRKALAKVRKP